MAHNLVRIVYLPQEHGFRFDSQVVRTPFLHARQVNYCKSQLTPSLEARYVN
jgi:hypothetical protein